MVAYWVARAKVNDPAQYKKYADLAPAIIGKFGGKFLARGGKFKILEGPEKFHRFVVIEFPSFEKAVACHESPEYLEAAAHRKKDGASELEVVIADRLGPLTNVRLGSSRHFATREPCPLCTESDFKCVSMECPLRANSGHCAHILYGSGALAPQDSTS